jgi:hypothetical protein
VSLSVTATYNDDDDDDDDGSSEYIVTMRVSFYFYMRLGLELG